MVIELKELSYKLKAISIDFYTSLVYTNSMNNLYNDKGVNI